MESTMEEDPTLPIDFDQTSNFAMFLKQGNLNDQDGTQSDITITSETINPDNTNADGGSAKKNKQRSYSTNDQSVLERPVSRGTMREEENIISELKKENFGLKMRIYYMEERLSDTFDASTEDILKKNIELKVTIEELKRDVSDNSSLLSKASMAMEQLAFEHEKNIDELNKEFKREYRNNEIKHEEEIKMKNLEIENLLKDSDNGALEENVIRNRINELDVLNAKLKNDIETLKGDREMEESQLTKQIKELEQTVQVKDQNIEALRKDVGKTAASPERSSQHYKKLYERLMEEVSTKDNLIDQLKKELANKIHFAENLKENMSNSDKTVKNLRSNLHEKEIENQRSISNLEEQLEVLTAQLHDMQKQLDNKDVELSRLKQEKLQANTKRVQFELDSLRSKDSQIVELTLKLKQQDFDLEKLKLLVDEKDKEVVFFSNSKLKLENEFTKYKETSEKQHDHMKDDTEKQNKEKRKVINEMKELILGLQEKMTKQNAHKDKVIQNLTKAICEKDGFIEELCGSQLKEKDGASLIETIKHNMKEREKQYKKTLDEHLTGIKKKEKEITKLQTTLREKENLLMQAETKCKGISYQLQESKQTEKNSKTTVQDLKMLLEKSEERVREYQAETCKTLKDKDEAISKLTGLLNLKDHELKNLTSYLSEIHQSEQFSSFSPNEVTERIDKAINSNDAIIEELTSLKESSITSAKLKHQQLLSVLKGKDQTIKELQKVVMNTENEKRNILSELNVQLMSAEEELKEKETSQNIEVKNQNVNTALLRLKNSQELEAEMFLQTVNEKDETIQALVKNGEDKDRIISELQTSFQSDNGKLGEMEKGTSQDVDVKNQTKLRQTVSLLKDDSSRKDEQLKDLRENNAILNNKLNEQKDSVDGPKNVAVNSLKENEKALIEELEQLVKAAEKEKAKYMELSEKLKNNEDTESQVNLLNHELDEVEQIRQNLQQLLYRSMRNAATQQPSQSTESLIIQSLEQNLQEKDNEITSLRQDLSRCEDEAKQLNADLAKLKTDYEQLVHERDQEISVMTKQLEQLKETNSLLNSQKEKMTKQLQDCHKKLDILRLKMDGSSSEKVELIQNRERLKEILKEIEEKNKNLAQMQNDLNTQSTENQKLKLRLKEAEKDLHQLNENNANMLNEKRNADSNIATLEAKLTEKLSTNDEKKQLKKDIKELCNINERLRSKVKDMTKSVEKLKSEKETESNSLYEEIRKAKETINELEKDILSRRKQVSELEDVLQEAQEKTQHYELVNEKCERLQSENEYYKRKVEDTLKASETKHELIHDQQTQQLMSQLTGLKNESDQLKTRQSEDCRNIEELKKKLKEKNSGYEKLEKKFTAAQKDHEKTRARLKKLEEEIDIARSQVCLLTDELTTANHDQKRFLRIQQETDRLIEEKRKLEDQLRELHTTHSDIKQQLSITQEDNFAKDKRIGVLTVKVGQLFEQLGSFSPLHTSSQQNIVLSNEASTQTTRNVNNNNNNNNDMEDDNSLIAQHIREMRELRKQLEETIRNNDSLRAQLEERLNKIEHDASMINDPHMRKGLIRDNDALRGKVAERDVSIKRMKNQIDELLKEKNSDSETIVSLQKQIHELNELSVSLKLEMEVYDRLVKQLGIDKTKPNGGIEKAAKDSKELDKNLLHALLEEIRNLRLQLQESMEANEALRNKLEQELGRPISASPLPPPFSTKRNLFTSMLGHSPTNDEMISSVNAINEFLSPHETPMKDEDVERYSSTLRKNPSIISSQTNENVCLCGKSTNYFELKKTSAGTLEKITNIQKKISAYCKRKDYSNMETMLKDINVTRKTMKEIVRLIDMFHLQDEKEDMSSNEIAQLRDEVTRLKKMLASKEQYIKSTLNIIEDRHVKNDLEESIKQQLLKTRDTLKATKGTLQKKADRSHGSNTSSSFDTMLHTSRDGS